MRVAVFSTKSYDREYLGAANEKYGHELEFHDWPLDHDTAQFCRGLEAVCAFVNDDLGAPVLNRLRSGGVRLIAMRCAGYNNVDVAHAVRAGITIARVPAYSPTSVAEHTVMLMLALNRKVYRAYNRVREGNFSLEGLTGFEMNGRTAGVIGTGKIGAVVAAILKGFGCRVLLNDKHSRPELEKDGAEYVDLERLFRESDIITLHCPLMEETHHIINAAAIEQMKSGVMLINTSRGALLDTRAVIAALKTGRIGYLGLDVYEEESELFFEDMSDRIIQDDVFMRMLTFPNVIVTGHQAFFTDTALRTIADVTLNNIRSFEKGSVPKENIVV